MIRFNAWVRHPKAQAAHRWPRGFWHGWKALGFAVGRFNLMLSWGWVHEGESEVLPGDGVLCEYHEPTDRGALYQLRADGYAWKNVGPGTWSRRGKLTPAEVSLARLLAAERKRADKAESERDEAKRAAALIRERAEAPPYEERSARAEAFAAEYVEPRAGILHGAEQRAAWNAARVGYMRGQDDLREQLRRAALDGDQGDGRTK